MWANLQLEAKRQPWLIYLLFFVVLTLSVTVPTVTRMTSKTVPLLSSYSGRVETNDQLAVPTVDYFRRAAILTAQAKLKASEGNKQAVRNKRAEQKWRSFLKKVIDAYQQSDYRRVNKVVFLALQDSQLTGHDVGQFYDRSELVRTHRLEYLQTMRKVITRGYDATPYVSEIGSASAALAATLGISGVTKRSDILFFSVMLAMLVVMLGYIYARDEQSGTASFSRITPQSRFAQVLMRAVWPITILNMLVVVTVICSVVLVSLCAHLPLGYLTMPYVFASNGELVVRTVLSYLAYFLIYFNLWAMLLVAASALIGGRTRNVLLSVFALGVLTFMVPLGLTNMLDGIAKYVPFAYSDFYSMYFGLGMYAHIDLILIFGLFLILTAVVAVADCLLYERQN